jgi:hypothetical protein
MRRITDVLTTEHTLLCILFDEIDSLLPGVRTVNEVRLLSRLVEGVLSHHADVEQNLAFAALDHVLAEKDELRQLHQDHEEIDTCLRDAALATELSEAVKLLKAGLKASRVHFRREEQSVFPLFEKMLAPSSLETLAAGASLGSSAPRPRRSRTHRAVDNAMPEAH